MPWNRSVSTESLRKRTGTDNKSRLGGQAMLAVSMAVQEQRRRHWDFRCTVTLEESLRDFFRYP